MKRDSEGVGNAYRVSVILIPVTCPCCPLSPPPSPPHLPLSHRRSERPPWVLPGPAIRHPCLRVFGVFCTPRQPYPGCVTLASACACLCVLARLFCVSWALVCRASVVGPFGVVPPTRWASVAAGEQGLHGAVAASSSLMCFPCTGYSPGGGFYPRWSVHGPFGGCGRAARCCRESSLRVRPIDPCGPSACMRGVGSRWRGGWGWGGRWGWRRRWWRWRRRWWCQRCVSAFASIDRGSPTLLAARPPPNAECGPCGVAPVLCMTS